MMDPFQRYPDFQYFKANTLEFKNQSFASMPLNVIIVFLDLAICFS